MLDDLRVTVLNRGPSRAYPGRDRGRFRIAFRDPEIGSVTLDLDIDAIGRAETGQTLSHSVVSVWLDRMNRILNTVAIYDGDPIPIDEQGAQPL